MVPTLYRRTVHDLEPIVGDPITDIIKNSIMCNNDIEDIESNISYAIDQLKRALKSISK